MIKILFWISAVFVAGYGLFKLIFTKALQCKRCGAIVKYEEYRAHDYKCKQKY